MEDLFEAITRNTRKHTQSRRQAARERMREETLAGNALNEAMGGGGFGERETDSAWLDLDHAIASSSARGKFGSTSSTLEELDSGSFGAGEEENLPKRKTSTSILSESDSDDDL